MAGRKVSQELRELLDLGLGGVGGTQHGNSKQRQDVIENHLHFFALAIVDQPAFREAFRSIKYLSCMVAKPGLQPLLDDRIQALEERCVIAVRFQPATHVEVMALLIC
jgi:hypothetical protein